MILVASQNESPFTQRHLVAQAPLVHPVVSGGLQQGREQYLEGLV